MATVDVYLPIESTNEWIHALSIPHRDIQRLTLRPLKWLRFAAFAVCGAKGHLSTTQGGETVDYETDSFDNLADRYYYTPDSGYHLIDYNVFNDRCTSSGITQRRSDFRQDICRRDDVCVITGSISEYCDAAHIIPRSKGSAYLAFVVCDRSSLYEHLPFPPEDGVGINCVHNGILLRKDLHRGFSLADIVFLKTPNFAMVPTDVPRVQEGPIPENRTTLQYIVEPIGFAPVPPWDVRVDWRDEIHPPPSILLDFMYGAAVVKRWKCDCLSDMLDERFETDLSKILAEDSKRSLSENNEPEVESDNDPGDPDWVPSRNKRKKMKTFSSDASAGLLEAMDDVLLLSILLKGTTPRMIAAEREKRRKEKELRSQEHGREKVREWQGSVSTIKRLLFE